MRQLAELIRIRGLVQGVGFRPTVWRLANLYQLAGDICNDGAGVLIRVQPKANAIQHALDLFCEQLKNECPPLARIDSIERSLLNQSIESNNFYIITSQITTAHTEIIADAASCPHCQAEIFDPSNRRYHYPFTNCTHCGPRFSITDGIPYDRVRTSMAHFALCSTCQIEYENPQDRRFHAQTNACSDCGPQIWLCDQHSTKISPEFDVITIANNLLQQGKILAIKGIGGFHLACDATCHPAVEKLRQSKHRPFKPFALMARDLIIIKKYCHINKKEAELLNSPAAPIVLLNNNFNSQKLLSIQFKLSSAIAPNQNTLGFMLPANPLQHLLLKNWAHPLVMTSGNLSSEPPCIHNEDALKRLAKIADYFILHNRAIITRLDDSVAHIIDDQPRWLRRARGCAPTFLPLPPGFHATPEILACGGELKNTICLIRDDKAIISQHLGDLAAARTAREYQATLDFYSNLLQHHPKILALDYHPDYHSSVIGSARAKKLNVPICKVQHHHAHLASVIADNLWPRTNPPVLGIILDGLGYSETGEFWGGEFLFGNYQKYQRVGHLRATALPGGVRAIQKPWRNLYAQLAAASSWEHFQNRYFNLSIINFIKTQQIDLLNKLIKNQKYSPDSTSAGRLFDAVAAALGISFKFNTYEGQAALELENLATSAFTANISGYPFDLINKNSKIIINPKSLWEPLFADLARGEAINLIAARFHAGFANGLITAGSTLAKRHAAAGIALGGGVFQNRLLCEAVTKGLRDQGWLVLLPRKIPSNDEGLALGQACVAAAWALEQKI